MICWDKCYAKYGNRVAILTLVFPGLGQLHNKQFFKAIAFAGTFCILSLFYLWLSLIQLVSYQSGLAEARGNLLLLMLIIWEASLFESFFCAIKTRKRDAKRVNTQTPVRVSGVDINNEEFEQVVAARNLSKTGACLVMPREIKLGSLLTFEFESKSKTRGRVIWQRHTGCKEELLGGIEFLAPLRAL